MKLFKKAKENLLPKKMKMKMKGYNNSYLPFPKVNNSVQCSANKKIFK